MNNPAIVITAFNRPEPLSRLLKSVELGNYNHFSQIALVISIDFQDSSVNKEVISIAERFKWSYGSKRVIKHKTNLGLKKHILKCGELTKEFGAIIMLEDDVFVSPEFYSYSVRMLERYEFDNSVAGISLYKHSWNVNVDRPFEPLYDGNDIFFMQFAQSWGQCFSERMWSDFYAWFTKNDVWGINDQSLPSFVLNWPESSWLKFYIKFLVANNKFFVYPYYSLSVNCNEVGTHNRGQRNNNFQVPLNIYPCQYALLPELKNGIIYDVFFERMDNLLFNNSEVNISDVCVDLYGIKSNIHNKRFILTSKILPFKKVKSYGLNFRPHELNITLENSGVDIFLYDTSIPYEGNLKSKYNKITQLDYDYNLSFKNAFIILFFKIKNKILKK